MAIDQEKILNLLKKHIDKIFVGALGADILVLLILMFGEKSNPDPVAPDVAVRDPKVHICAEEGKDCAEPYVKARTLIAQHHAFEESAFKPLADMNMFDAKSAKSSEELEKRADQAAAEAQGLFDQGQLEPARAKLADAFKYSYSHKAGRKLLAQIEAKLKPPAEAAAAAKPSEGGKPPEVGKPGAAAPAAPPPAPKP